MGRSFCVASDFTPLATRGRSTLQVGTMGRPALAPVAPPAEPTMPGAKSGELVSVAAGTPPKS